MAILSILSLLPVSVLSGWLDDGKDLLEKYTDKSGLKSSALTDSDIAAGLREALIVGTGNVVVRLGKENGFNGDPRVHIPLPEDLMKVRKLLKKVKQEKIADELELRLNRAAEIATPKARRHFMNAIRGMTLDDARRIWKGPEDSATAYFRGKMTSPLKKDISPIISKSLADAGAIKSYEKMMGRYRKLPFVPDVRADLTEYVTEKGLEGIFHYLAKEEAAIRKDPFKRTTELLKRVFGSE